MIYDYEAYLVDVGVPGMTITDVIRTNCSTHLCPDCDVRWFGDDRSTCWCCTPVALEACPECGHALHQIHNEDGCTVCDCTRKGTTR